MAAYYLGLDMGTSSVGWAVTNEQYELIKKKGKDLWGIREFDEAHTAVDRRMMRVSRRRRQRELARIGLLKEYFQDAIAEVDPNFYARLENSKYHLEDKDVSVRTYNGIFADRDYTDKEYFAEYPTIFHLRKELLESQEPHDVRLVYLALVNMFKHRGHFLNATLSSDSENRSIKDVWNEFAEQVYELLEISFSDEIDYMALQEIMCSTDISRKKKAEELVQLLKIDKKEKQKIALLECVIGLNVSIKTIFGACISDDFDPKMKISFSDAGYEEKIVDIQEVLGDENFELIAGMKALYDAAILNQIMGGNAYLSIARVQEYEKHKSDLKILKSIYRKYATKKDYDDMFRSTEKGSYSAYTNSTNSDKVANAENGGEPVRRGIEGRKKEDLYANIKKKLAEMPEDEDVQYVLNEIEKDHFLPKQLTASNGVIPNQIHLKEMKKILSNAENYLLFLKEKDESGYTTTERILKLFSFQIPYYVGPVTEKSARDGGNGWVVRKEDGVVLPWNINEKIDMKKTSEAFISRMVRRCTYMSGEQVLPKASLEYESFCVLNELNNLKVRGEKLPIEIKQNMYKDLFETGKRVTKNKIVKYLIGQGVLCEGNEDELTGLMDGINGTLSSFAKFRAVFGDAIYEDSCKKMVEQIIFWCTVYGDSKSFLKEQLEEKYAKDLTPEQMKRILGFKFKDWGNLSKEFLELNGCKKDTGEAASLIRMMWETNDNLMELLAKDKYTYQEKLQESQEKSYKILSEMQPEDLEDYYFSAPVKRMVWQTLLVIKEIGKVMGEPPKRLFVEMTRSEDKKKEMKDSRAKKFLELYKKIKDEDKDWKKIIESADEDGRIRSKKMYLYLTQKGRCMYTGRPIDLDQLFNNNLYDIDHIYPRHFVKDDNLENNLVLVEKEKNARKSDTYPLDEEIYKKQLNWWRELHQQNLINDEKFKRLTGRNPFSDEQKAGFIARQLVETSQGTKGVATILKEVLPEETTIVYAKARNVSDFRHDYNLLKSRIVNDFHHAQDAYLNIVVGNVYYVKFTQNPMNFIRENKSYNLGKMFAWDVKRGNETAWIAKPENGSAATIATVRKVMAKNTPLLTRLSFEGSGGIANQTLYSAKKVKEEGYIPLKSSDPKMQDIKKYGGYTSVTTAYFILVEHGTEKKRIRTIESVTLIWKDRIEKNPDELQVYCEKVLGLINPDIRVRKILIQSLIKREGYYMHISGKTENRLTLRNAVSLCLKTTWINYIKKLEKGEKTEEITKASNIALYEELMRKHKETIYAKRPNPVGDKLTSGEEKFEKLELETQIKILLEILKLTQIGLPEADLREIGGAKSTGTIKVGKKISGLHELKLIHQSVTGIYEQQVDLLTV